MLLLVNGNKTERFINFEFHRNYMTEEKPKEKTEEELREEYAKKFT